MQEKMYRNLSGLDCDPSVIESDLTVQLLLSPVYIIFNRMVLNSMKIHFLSIMKTGKNSV